MSTTSRHSSLAEAHTDEQSQTKCCDSLTDTELWDESTITNGIDSRSDVDTEGEDTKLCCKDAFLGD